MRDRSRARRALALALAAAATALGGAVEPGGGSVTLEITGLRSAKGQVLVCLTREARHFPDCSASPEARSAAVPAGQAHVTFANLPQSRYAIAVLHDENANGKADKTLGVIPREGFGFSRDARVRMGPPRFEQAAFTLGTDDVTQSVRMRYLM